MLDADFRWLVSVFNWAKGRKSASGARLLGANPLEGCEWPREKNVRRPIASHARFLATMENADTVDPAEPLRPDVASRWLLRAERLAELPKLARGGFHAFRRLWATERQGYSDVEVAASGGWKDVGTLKKVYQQATAAGMLRVVQAG